MDYLALKESLSHFNHVEVASFLAYIRRIEKDSKINWFQVLNKNNCKALFEQVKATGVSIDGESVTFSYVGKKLAVSYDYRAYKNRVLHVYPNASFDLQLVHEGDGFKLKKESGKVLYRHELNNPFDIDKKIIGAYCCIKTERGEFIETLNLDEIKKIQATAKTQYIWNKWRGEMILKSVIKRACKRHLADLAKDIDTLDNVNYDLGPKVEVSEEAKQKIKEQNKL